MPSAGCGTDILYCKAYCQHTTSITPRNRVPGYLVMLRTSKFPPEICRAVQGVAQFRPCGRRIPRTQKHSDVRVARVLYCLTLDEIRPAARSIHPRSANVRRYEPECPTALKLLNWPTHKGLFQESELLKRDCGAETWNHLPPSTAHKSGRHCATHVGAGH